MHKKVSFFSHTQNKDFLPIIIPLSTFLISHTKILELNWIAWVLKRDWKIIPLAAISLTSTYTRNLFLLYTHRTRVCARLWRNFQWKESTLFPLIIKSRTCKFLNLQPHLHGNNLKEPFPFILSFLAYFQISQAHMLSIYFSPYRLSKYRQWLSLAN